MSRPSTKRLGLLSLRLNPFSTCWVGLVVTSLLLLGPRHSAAHRLAYNSDSSVFSESAQQHSEGHRLARTSDSSDSSDSSHSSDDSDFMEVAQQPVQQEQLMQKAAYNRFLKAVKGDPLGNAERLSAKFKKQASSVWALSGKTLSKNSNCQDAFWLSGLPGTAGIRGNMAMTRVDFRTSTSCTTAETCQEQCALVCAMAVPAVVQYVFRNPAARWGFVSLFQEMELDWKDPKMRSFDRSCTAFSYDPDNGGCTLLRSTCHGIGNVNRLRVPGAVAFCANKFAYLGQESDRFLVKQCQQALSKASGGDGLEEFVCADECEDLVAQIRREHEVNSTEGQSFRQAAAMINATALLLEPVLALGELCVKHVVRKVEAKNLKCCALGCGWDAANSTCSGLHLLPPASLGRWWSECCNSGAVLWGSDRQRMCEGARPVVQAMPSSSGPRVLGLPEMLGARTPWQAFESGQNLTNPRAGGLGAAGPGAPVGAALLQAEGGLDLDPCKLQCQMPWALETSLLQCAASGASRWFATASALKCEQPARTEQVETPDLCGQNAKTGGALYASWQFTPGNGRVEGTCRHFGLRCKVNWATMVARKKATIANSTDVMWLAVSEL